ncbi:MAG: hypothetical protein IJW86_06715 [Clostridia bacterium]|nr:hypothetical protein [Clostridia bacterium]
MKTLSMALQKAQALGCETEFKQCMIAMQNLYEVSRLGTGEEELSLDRSSDGRVLSTIDNYVKIFEGDEEFKFLRFNSLSRSAETLCDGKTVKWTDTHDSQAKNYFEKNYGICAEAKYENALRIILSKRSYHPVRELIESIEWDGESRIYTFLTKCMRAEDTPYTREVSRLIFAGGIHRLYNPGCKFDDMPVLIGTRQGEGKSTIVRWLALKDEFFTEVNEFEGQRGIESLEGAWICEVSELLALTKTKEQEAVKSYLSRLNDRYRMPFDKRVTDHPRQCVFIGTTNKEQFLTDKTGNRRYYPVRVYQSAHNLYEHEKEIKEYILQCWAEASFLYSKGELKPYADPDMEELIREKQSEAVQDDYRVGMIRDYLETKNEVCIPMLWYEALKMRSDIKPTRKDSCDIALIMQGMVGWEKKNNTHFFKDYGSQRWWKKEWIEL